jgi:hypothetical protein
VSSKLLKGEKKDVQMTKMITDVVVSLAAAIWKAWWQNHSHNLHQEDSGQVRIIIPRLVSMQGRRTSPQCRLSPGVQMAVGGKMLLYPSCLPEYCPRLFSSVGE